MALLPHHVIHVFLSRTKKHVLNIHTGRIVAFMEYQNLWRNVALFKHPCNAMGSRLAMILAICKATISFDCAISKPWNATMQIRSTALRLEAPKQRLVELRPRKADSRFAAGAQQSAPKTETKS